MTKRPITEPGIRGWLILLTIFTFASPGNFMAHAHLIEREFDRLAIRQFADSSNPAFDARWSILIFSETSGFIILAFACFFVLWPLFFLRHHLFRLAFSLVAIACASLLTVRAVLAAIIPTVAPLYRASIYSQTALWLPVSLAFAAYVIRSRRA